MAPAKRIPAALRAVVAAAPGIWKPASGIPAAAIHHQALTVNWCSTLLTELSMSSNTIKKFNI
jgi:hypothetical protein